ncbi:Mbov_0397 family ICE element conjugal transfer ATPase [[Mycoplasma] gypis]|uniref:Zonular occludens toxin domain-containing protein n=1 Tax=[Mycoplasma] gypis TaxID=92404 RepID=A0ABZ2RNF0_9BACT|nr:zonular occludens toxin domain-containing protein [[Mycoplasma] gypis]MBN0919386.1 ATP-binding protein [[Mycoplasma] gypis]
MKQAKNLKQNKIIIFRDFSLLDISVSFVLSVLAILVGLILPLKGIYKLFSFIGLVIAFNLLLIKNSKHNCRLYVLVFRQFLYLISIKTYKKNTKQETYFLVPYSGFSKNGSLIANNKVVGKSYTKIIKFSGKNIWNEEETDIKRFLDNIQRIIELVDGKISFIRLKQKSNYDKNFDFIDKNITENNNFKKSKYSQNFKDYYAETIKDIGFLNNDLLVDNYYISLTTLKDNRIDNQLDLISSELNNAGLSNEVLDKKATLKLISKLIYKDLSEEEIEELLKDENEVQKQVKSKNFKQRFINFWFNNNDYVYANSKFKKIFSFDEVKFSKNFIKCDDKYLSILKVNDVPSTLSESYLDTLLNNDSTFILNLSKVNSNTQEKIIDTALKNLEINARDTKSHYKSNLSNNEIENVEFLLEQVQEKSVNLFNASIYLISCAESEKELKKINEDLYIENRKYNFYLNNYIFRQFEIFGNIFLRYNKVFNDDLIMTSKNIVWGWSFNNDKVNDGNSLFLGTSLSTDEEIIFNQFYLKDKNRSNHNMFINGSSGSGKSTVLKKILANNLVENNRVYLLDTQNEYGKINKYFGADEINFGGGTTKLNPLQVVVKLIDKQQKNNLEIIFNKHREWLENYFTLAISELRENEIRALIKLINELYLQKGVYNLQTIEELKTFDWMTIDDLIQYIKEKKEKVNKNVFLEEYIMLEKLQEILTYFYGEHGKYRLLYNGKTNINFDNYFVCFNTSQLFNNSNNSSEKLGIFILLSFLQDKIYDNFVKNKDKKTLIIIDEVHRYFNNDITLQMLFDLTKTVRKFNTGLILATQNTSDLFINKDGVQKAMGIFNNCQYLLFLALRQNDIELISQNFKANGGLTQSEIRFLANAEIGNGIFSLNTKHKIPLKIYYNDLEKELFFDKGEIGKYNEQ